MTKRMLIDDTQPEETRVVVVNGNKLEDVEFESSSRKQIKGNVYLAKVMRIEPSLPPLSTTAATATGSSLSAKSIPTIIMWTTKPWPNWKKKSTP